jgi:hypothetical protein
MVLSTQTFTDTANSKIIFKWIFQGSGWVDVDWIYLAQDRDKWRALNKAVNESSGSIKCGEFRVWLRSYQLVKENSAPCTKLQYRRSNDSVSQTPP